MKNIFVILFATAFIYFGCGDPSVNIEEIKYEPKIVVDGYIYPGEPVKSIWLMRNFELNQPVDSNDIYLNPESNQLQAKINNIPLSYDPATKSFYTNDLQINFGQTYRLVVDAVIDGVSLHTQIETTTPQEGFDLIKNNLGEFMYRRDPIKLNFHPSPGTGFYAFSIRAEDATQSNFIFDNPFFPNIDSTDLADKFNQYKFQYNLLLNVNGTVQDTITYDVLGLDTWFYGNYKVIVYAGDTNMKDYIITASNVQSFDGNFKEPVVHFTGNGIGVFGSAIRDTVTFTLLPRN